MRWSVISGAPLAFGYTYRYLVFTLVFQERLAAGPFERGFPLASASDAESGKPLANIF